MGKRISAASIVMCFVPSSFHRSITPHCTSASLTVRKRWPYQVNKTQVMLWTEHFHEKEPQRRGLIDIEQLITPLFSSPLSESFADKSDINPTDTYRAYNIICIDCSHCLHITIAAQKRISIIIATTRQSRVGPQITRLVHQTIASVNSNTNLQTIDIRDWGLPMYDEPEMPVKVKSPENYANEYTRKWSQEISSYHGFVFVTAQYNWSIPASLKNALDYLFHEWKAKPALIVSYGGRGGGKAANALTEICTGLKMRPFPETIQLPFSVREGFLEEVQYGRLPDDAEKLWHVELAKLKNVWPSFEQTFDSDGEKV